MSVLKEKSREYYINHQKVTLDIDFDTKTILASTELLIYINIKDIPYIRLNSKNCEINNVSVNDLEVLFEIFDPCKEISEASQFKGSKDPDYYTFQKLHDLATSTSQNGELSFKIPEEIDLSNHLAPEIAENLEADELNGTNEPIITSPLLVKIDYTMRNPSKGIAFTSNCRAEEEKGASYLHTLNRLGPGDASNWVPTKDEVYSRHTWELDFLISERRNHENKKIDMDVVSSGILVDKVELTCDPPRTLYSYLVSTSCSAYLVAFAVGRFESLILAELDSFQNEHYPMESESDNTKKIHGYAPFGWDLELRNSCQVTDKIMDFYINEFGAFPLDSAKLVFLKISSLPLIIGHEVIILSIDFLHTGEIIDQTFETRRIIALALASQWFGVCVIPKLNPDIWLTLGLSGFMCSLFLRAHFGLNEYRYRMKQDMVTIARLDSERPPIFNNNISYPYDPEEINFIRLKSTFVLYMLDKQMLKGAASFGLHRIIPKILSSAFYGELEGGNFLNTQWFLKSARKLSGVDIRSFNDQWIYKSGCPIFEFKYSFNRKKMVVEISFSQTHTNAGLDPNFEGYDNIKPCQAFTGAMTASIREPDGTPYEHVLEIQEDSEGFEVQFNTKYKRIRRSTKRFQKRKAEAAAAEAIVKDQLDEKNADNDELFLTEEGNEEEKKAWKIVEWGDMDKESLESATFEWIRLDSDFEWICIVKLDQPDYMWAGQLEKDRDVVSQFEAVEALKDFPSQATSTTLLRTVMNSQCFYRIRADAAKVLIHCSNPNSEYIGKHHLFKMFSKKYNLNEELQDPLDIGMYRIRPNDFSNFSEYFVLKAIILAISCLGDLSKPNDETPKDTPGQLLVLKLLKENDNSGNPYSDSYYLSTLITAVGNLFDHEIAHRKFERLSVTAQSLIDELKRYSNMDYLIPSYHNVITTSCLQSYTKLFIKGVLPPDLKMFMNHSRYGNFSQVRMAAFDGLLLQGGLLVPSIQRYFLRTILRDPELHLRTYIAYNLARTCALYKKSESEKPVEEDNFGPILLDDPSQLPPESYSREKWENFTKNLEIKRSIWKIILDDQVDAKTRRSMLIICKLIYPSTFSTKTDVSMFKLRSVNYFPDPVPPVEPSPIQPLSKSDTIIKIRAPIQSDIRTVFESNLPTAPTRSKTPPINISLKSKSPAKVRPELNTENSILDNQVSIIDSKQLDSINNDVVENIPEITSATSLDIPFDENIELPNLVETNFQVKAEPSTPVIDVSKSLKHGVVSDRHEIPTKVESAQNLSLDDKLTVSWSNTAPKDKTLAQFASSSPKTEVLSEDSYHPKNNFNKSKSLQVKSTKTPERPSAPKIRESKEQDATTKANAEFLEKLEACSSNTGDAITASVNKKHSVNEPSCLEGINQEDSRTVTPLKLKHTLETRSEASVGLVVETKVVSPEVKARADVDKDRRIAYDKVSSKTEPYIKDVYRTKDSSKLNITQARRSNLSSPLGSSGGVSSKLISANLMPLGDYENALQIVLKMLKHEHAHLYVGSGSSKIDLPKIESKVKDRQYIDFGEFRKDFRKLLDSFPRGPTDPTKEANALAFRSFYLAERKKVTEREEATTNLSERKRPAGVSEREKVTPPAPSNSTLEQATKVLPSQPVKLHELEVNSTPKQPASIHELDTKDELKRQAPGRETRVEHRLEPTKYQDAKALLKLLMGHEDAQEFKNAIENVITLGSSHPNAPVLCLNSIRYKLKNRQYASVDDMFTDIQKILVIRTKKEGGSLSKKGQRLFDWFCKEWLQKFPNFKNDHLYPASSTSDKKQKIEAKTKVEPNLEVPSSHSRISEKSHSSTTKVILDSPNFKPSSSIETAVAPSVSDVVRFCKSIVTLLVDSPSSPLFRQPVDAKKLNIPTYYKIIKKPMDLSTLKNKLDSGNYKTVDGFDTDVKLIFANAYSFNDPLSLPYTEAKKLETYYKSIIKKSNLILTDHFYPLLQKVVSKIGNMDCLKALESYIDAKIFTEPMNLDRIKKRLMKKLYSHFGEFEYDFKTLLSCVLAEVSESSKEFELAKELESNYVRLHKRYLDFYTSTIGTLCTTYASELVTAINKPKCEAILKKVSTHKSAIHFLEPVDYKALKIPDYPKTIRNPMDFGTIKSKLRGRKYLYLDDFYNDIKLVFTNCYNFNGIDSYYGEEANKVEILFEKEWKLLKVNVTAVNDSLPISSPAKKIKLNTSSSTIVGLPASVLTKLDKILKAFAKHPYHFLVAEPVDPVKLNIPTYFNVIKNPMDFGTIRNKLTANKYNSVNEVIADADLVFKNCFTFNYPGDDAYKFGKELQIEWNKLCKVQGVSKLS